MKGARSAHATVEYDVTFPAVTTMARAWRPRSRPGSRASGFASASAGGTRGRDWRRAARTDRRHSRFHPALRPGVGGAGRRRRRPAAGGARPRLQDTPEHRRARGRRGRRSRCRGAPAGTREAGGLAARLLRPRALAGGDCVGGASAAQFVRCWRSPAHAVHEAGVRGPRRRAGPRRGEQGYTRRGAMVEPPDGAAPLPRFTLYWTGRGERMTNGQWAGFPLGDGSAVAAGDRLRLAFSPGSDGTPTWWPEIRQNGISMLYPASPFGGRAVCRPAPADQAPGDGRWFSVDPRAGLAAMDVVAGHEPLEHLEELLDDADAGAIPRPGSNC